MTAKYVTPAWEGPDSPQGPVRAEAQSEFKPPVFAACYRAAPIASCPDCCGDCIDEGFDFWCPACRKSYSPGDVGWFEREHDDFF